MVAQGCGRISQSALTDLDDAKSLFLALSRAPYDLTHEGVSLRNCSDLRLVASTQRTCLLVHLDHVFRLTDMAAMSEAASKVTRIIHNMPLTDLEKSFEKATPDDTELSFVNGREPQLWGNLLCTYGMDLVGQSISNGGKPMRAHHSFIATIVNNSDKYSGRVRCYHKAYNHYTTNPPRIIWSKMEEFASSMSAVQMRPYL